MPVINGLSRHSSLSRRTVVLGGACAGLGTGFGLSSARVETAGRIAFIDESGPPETRGKRVAIMDLTGSNVRYLTDGRELVFTPRFSPSGRLIAYVTTGAYVDDVPSWRVDFVEISSGRRETVAEQAFAPCFSPDGRTLVVSVARPDGGAGLHAIDLATKAFTRLTSGEGTDSAACYSPDGKSICFESDRAGVPQIYLINASGGAARRIGSDTGAYSAPTWSPRGDIIAFTRMIDCQWTIGCMRADGSHEVVLTHGSDGPNPTFSPDGQTLMFSRDECRGSCPSLFTINLDGRNEAWVPTAGDASEPHWATG